MEYGTPHATHWGGSHAPPPALRSQQEARRRLEPDIPILILARATVTVHALDRLRPQLVEFYTTVTVTVTVTITYMHMHRHGHRHGHGYSLINRGGGGGGGGRGTPTCAGSSPGTWSSSTPPRSDRRPAKQGGGRSDLGVRLRLQAPRQMVR